MNKFILVFLLVLLSGCSWTKDLMVKTEPVARIPLVLPEADIYYHRNIEWRIITRDNAEEVFNKLQKDGKPVVLIGLTGSDYELLSLNVADQQLLIKQLNAIITAYKTYYMAVEKRDKDLKVTIPK